MFTLSPMIVSVRPATICVLMTGTVGFCSSIFLSDIKKLTIQEKMPHFGRIDSPLLSSIVADILVPKGSEIQCRD